MQNLIEQSKTIETFTTKPTKENYVSLIDQINQLMQTLPPNMQQRDWSMSDLLTRLEGKFKDRPSAMKVAEALRILGWSRHRDHSLKGGGGRFWRRPNYTS